MRDSRTPRPHERVTIFLVLICLAASLGLTVLDGQLRLERVARLSQIRLNDQPPQPGNLATGAREEHLLLPGSSMDAKWWVLHTRRMLEAGGWRIRGTTLDNAPDGREVHWSSSLMWILAGVARILSLFSGQPLLDSVSHAALWAGPLMQAGFFLLLCGLVFRRYGFLPAAFYGLVFLTSYPISRTFQAGEADHHGLVLAFAAAGVLCLLAGGGGYFRREKARTPIDLPAFASAARWFALSGVFGAAALWISAATAIPILFASGLGALATAAVPPPDSKNIRYAPGLWMTWAKAGCLASIGFYLLEYFPAHLGWRLEVNHPLYAFAWLGGGFLVQTACAGMAERKLPDIRRGLVVRASISLLAVAAPIACIAAIPQHVFWVADPFLLSLHKEYIFEFQSLPALVGKTGGGAGFLTYYPWVIFVVIGACWLSLARAWSPVALRGFLLTLPPALVMQALALYQVRWSSAAFAMWSVCALCIFTSSSGSESAAGRWVHRLALAACFAALLVTQIPQVTAVSIQNGECTKPPIREENGNGIILRDIAHRLIRSSPQAVPTVLTGPNSSTDLAYFGQIKTMGTLYWENMPGLKRAARIFASQNEKEALTALTAAGVTHIVIPSWDNFSDAYTRLLKLDGMEAPDSAYFQSLLKGENWPSWLRPFAYPIPNGSGLDSSSVRIFAVLPQQNAFESEFFRGVYHFESGEPGKARTCFEAAKRIRPGEPRVESFLRQIGNPPPANPEHAP